MIKKLLVFTLGFISFGLKAQSFDKCGTMPSLEHRLEHDAKAREYLQAKKEKESKTRSSATFDTTGYLIVPVVFHVVYNPSNPEQNIPDSVIQSQLDVLNRDYGYTHPFVSSTLPVFDSIAANTGIKFCLATVDPEGNPTTGITRTSSTTNHLLTVITQSVKSDAAGGKDPWPTNKYFNIWVCSMFPGLLGYAQFPGDDPTTDGVVLAYAYVGENPGAPTAPNNLGRTATHEGGHWFGMRHVWGDGACGVEDGVDDTPDSDAASSQDCMLTRNDCDDAMNLFWNGYDPVDMVQNFMDYSADGCMTLFTRQQTNKMWHNIVTHRDSLFYSGGCGTPAINGYVITQNLTCPTSCDGQATVTVASGTAPFTYLWDDPMAQTTATAIGLCKGEYTVRVIDADNDTMYIQSWVTNATNVTGMATTSSASICGHYGIIELDAVGGVAPYLYSFDNGLSFATSNVSTDMASGIYPVIIKDNCGSELTITVEIDSVILNTTETHVDDACGNCGSITVTANGGNGGYTYQLDSLAPQTSNVFTGLAAGVYTIIVTDTCGNSDTLTVEIDNTIGLAEELNAKGVLVYPNPVKDELFLRFAEAGFMDYLMVTDMTGKIVLSTKLNSGLNLVSVDVSMLESGMYLLQLSSAAKPIFINKKFSKQ